MLLQCLLPPGYLRVQHSQAPRRRRQSHGLPPDAAPCCSTSHGGMRSGTTPPSDLISPPALAAKTHLRKARRRLPTQVSTPARCPLPRSPAFFFLELQMGEGLVAVLCFLMLISGALSATFTFSNNCEHTVWPGLLSGAGTPALSTTGFALNRGETRSVPAPGGWSGRFWGRTLCSVNPATGKFTCATGDCGTGAMECSGSGALPPASLAEFTLDGSGGKDFYDVSLVDGYNLPILVLPQGGGGGGGNSSCVATGCLVDLNGVCPSELRVKVAGGGGEGVACRSACEAFGNAEYCCSGAYGSPDTCRPSSYSEFFKSACPRAYSYAYDDGTSTFTCPAGTSYLVTFCPTTASQKSAGGNNPQAVPVGGADGGDAVVYQGALLSSHAAAAAARPVLLLGIFLLRLLF